MQQEKGYYGLWVLVMKLKQLDDIPYEEIDDQIAVRLDLMRTIVGNLYPRVLSDEITNLRDRQQIARR